MSEKEIAELFYEPLGRIAIKYARLDDNLAMTIFTLCNPDPMSQQSPQVVSIGGSMDQSTWRLIISCTTINQRNEMMRRVAKSRFPDKEEAVEDLYKQIEKAIKKRNDLMHHGWYNKGQMGFNRNGVFKTEERTTEELNEFGDMLTNLSQRVMDLHGDLLEIFPKAKN